MSGPEVLAKFPPVQAVAPEGFTVNWLGVLTDARYTSGPEEAHPLPGPVLGPLALDEDLIDWLAVLESVSAAKGHYTIVELGAGWGRWVANAAAAARQYGIPAGKCTLVGVEAEPTHFAWMSEHLDLNVPDETHCLMVEAAVDGEDGETGFYFGKPAEWYGQSIGGPEKVKAVSLKTLLAMVGPVDLIMLDVQGRELIVLKAASRELDRQVCRVHIGTHSPDIEEGLRELFASLGWTCLHDYAMGGMRRTPYGEIMFQDGVQSWMNPREVSA